MGEPLTKQSGAAQAVVDLTGTTVGRFAVRSRLGAGGMGEVYRADDTKLKRPVALKRLSLNLREDRQYRQRLLKEAERTSALNHLNIASVYDVLEEKDEVFLVMEYVEGETLRRRLKHPMEVESFLPIASQIAEAVAAAHEKGIAHHDIKPENIMLRPDGAVKVLDFGVARRLPSSREGTTTFSYDPEAIRTFAGTLSYAAPEVLLEKKADGRADIFSLGIVFYETLTGQHPFRGSGHAATIDRILHENPPPPSTLHPRVPSALDQVVAKMLAKDPEDRYATTRDLLVDLRALVPERLAPAPRRAVWKIAGAILAGLLVVGAAVPSVRQQIKSWLGIVEALPSVKYLAVLPFDAVGDDPQAMARAHGLTATLTAKLTQLTERHSLQVASASEVRDKNVRTSAQARQELGVTLTLEGSLHLSGDRVRITYNLVDTETLQQLRGGMFTAEAANTFAVEDHVVEGAVNMLELELEPQESRALAAHGTSEQAAHTLYDQGQGYLSNYDRPENVDSAIRNFKGALEIDPSYAQAYAGLGEAYWRMYEGTEEPSWVDKARTSCERASELSPALAAAHICLGTLYSGTGRYQEAEGEFQRALEAESTNDAAYRGLALAQSRLGKLEQAEETYLRAIAERPGYWAGYDWLGSFYARELSRFEDAAALFEEARKRAPGNVRVLRNLGGAYLTLGRYQEAQTALYEALAIRPTSRTYENLGGTYFHLREFGQAVVMYEEATELASRDYITWGSLARSYYWAPGLRDKAPEIFQRAVALAQERLQINPNDADVRISLAYYYAMLGERNLSLANLRQALQASPKNAEFLFWAAVVYNQFGESEKAREQLEQAIAGGYSLADLRAAVEFDNLRGQPRMRELLGAP